MLSPGFKFVHRGIPYFLLLLAGALAYLPVSTMMFALKNDIIALEYPINYFISECLQNGISPLWFNTWAGGFPLESILTWSIFSPVRFIFSGLFSYSLYTLHFEFIFFIVISGFSMFALLKKHFCSNVILALLLSCCYMLSGFNVGSSQWLLYITASAFFPLLLNTFLSLLKNPSPKTSLLFGAVFYLHLTSVYVAFTIIAVYILFAIMVFYLWKYRLRTSFKRTVYFLGTSGIFIMVISIPCIYSTLQLLQYLDRGSPIDSNIDFFNSNFLPLSGLQTLLLPLAAVKIPISNTEGTMLNCYIGLTPILLLPACVQKTISKKQTVKLSILIVALFFMFISLGNLTPLRSLLNYLPGFAYFRNSGLFRLFFLFFILLFIASSFAHDQWFKSLPKKMVMITSGLIITFFFVVIGSTIAQLSQLKIGSIKETIQNLTYKQTILISAPIQLILLLLLIYTLRINKLKFFSFLVFGDLILNTLLCIPFFTVSSYSVEDVSKIFQPVNGFPAQTALPSQVPTTHSEGNAVWPNINIYKKQVSLQNSYWGPLVLKSYHPIDTISAHTTMKPFLSASNTETNINMIEQSPNYIKAFITVTRPNKINLTQNFYPGWKAFHNKKEIKLNQNNSGMNILVPTSGVVEFKYQKSWLFYSACLINLLVISCFLFQLRPFKTKA